MWEYVTLFVLAATPLVELLVVIPLGLAYGLPPASVALVTFIGNTLPVLGIVTLHGRWSRWRRGRNASTARAGEGGELGRGRWRRARGVWIRYGVPGLALLAPLVTGAHVAAVAALGFGSPRRLVLTWLTLSILVWTVGLTLGVSFGLAGARYFLE